MSTNTTTRQSTARFREIGYYERLIELRTANPDAFAVLSPAEKLTLGVYEANKREDALRVAEFGEAGEVAGVIRK